MFYFNKALSVLGVLMEAAVAITITAVLGLLAWALLSAGVTLVCSDEAIWLKLLAGFETIVVATFTIAGVAVVVNSFQPYQYWDEWRAKLSAELTRTRPVRWANRGWFFLLLVLVGLCAASPAQAAQPQQVEVKPFTMQQERALVFYGACLVEAFGKAQTRGFVSNFMRQFGVQVQVACMEDANLISRDPTVAAVQGFLIGL
jgi:hypothetical protein